MLWDLFLVIVGLSWVFPLTVRHFLLAWQGANVGRNCKRIWMTIPFYLFWTLWKERNRAAFEDEAPFVHSMKATFLCTLWSWAKLYGVDNKDSLVDLLAWLRYSRIGEVESFFGFPFLYL